MMIASAAAGVTAIDAISGLARRWRNRNRAGDIAAQTRVRKPGPLGIWKIIVRLGLVPESTLSW